MDSAFSFAGLLVSIASIILVTRVTVANASKSDLEKLREQLRDTKEELRDAKEQLEKVKADCEACYLREERLMRRVLKLEEK